MTTTLAAQELTVRCGFEFAYEATGYTPSIFTVLPRLDRPQRKLSGHMIISPDLRVRTYQDSHGNIVQRFTLPPGRTTVTQDVFIASPATYENDRAWVQSVPVADLPSEYIKYVLPSRYCDSDRLMTFAAQQFGHCADGLTRVQAICDWVHNNIQYRWGAGSPHTTASDVLNQGFGVCRDFAHLAVALTRCFNMPARYVTGYVPDIGVWDPGSPMDFHAYMEVYAGGGWHVFDARFNAPRLGRVHIARGLDAVDGAFSTLFGPANLAWFSVWAYQVDPAQVHLGDPIDLSKRLDGSPTLRFP